MYSRVKMGHFPEQAPFDKAQRQAIRHLVDGLSAAQANWLSGWLTGVSGSIEPSSSKVQRKLAVLYGTESGNSEELAGQVFKSAKQKRYKPALANMAETRVGELKNTDILLVVVSTWGDGEPPETAEEFYHELMSADISLDGVEFAVCALGDTSYEKFCQTGREIDARLEKLGAKRIAARVDCDVDYDESFSQWTESIWSVLGESSESSVEADVSLVAAVEYGRKNPFPAEVLDNQLLSGDRSDKETIHLELSLEGAGLRYEPGDVLAVLPCNAKDVVDAVLSATGLAADAIVKVRGGGRTTLGEALTGLLDVTGLSHKVASAWQEVSGSGDLAVLLEDNAKSEFRNGVMDGS